TLADSSLSFSSSLFQLDPPSPPSSLYLRRGCPRDGIAAILRPPCPECHRRRLSYQPKQTDRPTRWPGSPNSSPSRGIAQSAASSPTSRGCTSPTAPASRAPSGSPSSS